MIACSNRKTSHDALLSHFSDIASASFFLSWAPGVTSEKRVLETASLY